MKQYKVAILGATGAVGREMMKILAESHFPISELHLLASKRSAGKVVEWEGRPIMIEEACDEAFNGIDIVLGAAETTSQSSSPQPSSRRAPSLWTIPPRSVWMRTCRSSFRRSTPRT